MKINHHHIKIGRDKLHYTSQGTGEKVVVAFHGFGQSNLAFREFGLAFGEQITLISIDLFGHGRSDFLTDEILFPKKLKLFLEAVFERHNVHRFDILAFSIGARYAMLTMKSMYTRIDNVFLIAPDGVKDNLVYSLVTTSRFFKKQFARFVIKPQFFSQMVLLLARFRIIKRAYALLLIRLTKTRFKRLLIYRTWVSLSHSNAKRCNLNESKEKIAGNLIILYSSKDRFISPNAISSFVRKNSCESLSLSCHHHELIKESIDYFKEGNWPDRNNTSSSAQEAKL